MRMGRGGGIVGVGRIYNDSLVEFCPSIYYSREMGDSRVRYQWRFI
jgi:hypothetical protein